MLILFQNPVGAGRYDIQKWEEAQHKNGHRSVFRSKTTKPGAAREKFLQWVVEKLHQLLWLINNALEGIEWKSVAELFVYGIIEIKWEQKNKNKDILRYKWKCSSLKTKKSWGINEYAVAYIK